MSEIKLFTLGNATIVVEVNGKPVFCTDPWFAKGGNAYFGSWTLPVELTSEALSKIENSSIAWISHPHPDHLCIESIRQTSIKKLLLAKHSGNRTASDLRAIGFEIIDLEPWQWYEIDKDLFILTAADINQDSILLIKSGSTLVANINDAYPRYLKKKIRNIILESGCTSRFLLKLFGFGDANLINFYDEDMNFIDPGISKERNLKESMISFASSIGCNYAIPFSSFHTYQRSDTCWANQYVADTFFEDEYENLGIKVLPAFLEIDMKGGTYTSNGLCKRRELVIKDPIEFDDDWDERLTKADRKLITEYFEARKFVLDKIDLIQFQVGGEETSICLNKNYQDKAIVFHVPRNSLMTSISYEIFDDLLISNIPKVQLRGFSNLYQCKIIPEVTKYCDNGKVKSKSDMAAYKSYYRNDAGLDWVKDELINKFAMRVRNSSLLRNKKVLEIASKVYFSLK